MHRLDTHSWNCNCSIGFLIMAVGTKKGSRGKKVRYSLMVGFSNPEC
jgi:hypothetical protein